MTAKAQNNLLNVGFWDGKMKIISLDYLPEDKALGVYLQIRDRIMGRSDHLVYFKRW